MPNIAEIAQAAANAIGVYNTTKQETKAAAEIAKKEVEKTSNTLKYLVLGAVGLVVLLTVIYIGVKRK